MKRVLKFLIFSLGLVFAQGVMAVTLPSQSYVPDPNVYLVTATNAAGEAKVVGTTFAKLGESATGPIEQYCTSTYSTVAQKAQCTQCCSDKVTQLCEQDPDNCDTYEADADSCLATCASYSLPLDGGIYLIIALAVAFGAAKAVSTTAQQRLKLSV
ncbi:MAG: hypothetical protein J6P34_04010 [Paludibacteraceae bacterium]|nr:hypothetical protein [Paludibacteraceae bacterium]MBO7367703.1 hypothetical protein [Paludibacteraceae bacterium]